MYMSQQLVLGSAGGRGRSHPDIGLFLTAGMLVL